MSCESTRSGRVSPVKTLVDQEIEKLRAKLLDLTSSNPLVSYSHTRRGRRAIRVIDELPDELFNRLDADESLRFKSLGVPTSEPVDEKRIEFRRAMDAAKLEDPDYLAALRGAGDDPGERVLDRLDSELRARVRKQLGLPARSGHVADPEAAAVKRGLNPAFDLPAPSAITREARHADGFVQTRLFAEQMERMLGSLRDEVRTSIEETGVNPLHCVFGFLEWFESDSSELPRHAPLVVYPLEIDREVHRGQWEYRIKSSGEGATTNAALEQRLKNDFGMALPPLDEDRDTPETYFTKVARTIAAKPGWKVRRWITIGLFRFQKIAMYRDLDPARWSDLDPQDQRSMVQLLAGQAGAKEYLTEYTTSSARQIDDANDSCERDERDELDRLENSVWIVKDADPSQLEAIDHVRRGHDLVIEGPPGTGKSQTITNIIAGALAEKKTVLFVAEKMAALNVVRGRLQEVGLGDFCFELHSNKAGRRETFQAFARRLNRESSWSNADLIKATVEELGTCRASFSRLVAALAEQLPKLGVTVQELLWKVDSARRRLPDLCLEVDEIRLEHADALTSHGIDRMLASVARFASLQSDIVSRYHSERKNPWFGFSAQVFDILTQDKAVSRLALLRDAAGRAARNGETFEHATGWRPTCLGELEASQELMHFDAPDPLVAPDVVAKLRDPDVLAQTEQFLCDSVELLTCEQQLAATFTTPSLIQDGFRLRQTLGLSHAFKHDFTMEAVSAEVTRLEVKARLLSNVTNELNKITTEVGNKLSSAGTPLDGSPGSLTAIIAAARFLRTDENSNPIERVEAFTDDGNAPIIAQAHSVLASILQRRSELNSRFDLEECPSATTLRQHARALRGAPMFPWLSAEYRNARRVHRERARVAVRRSRDELAREFDDLADSAAAQEAFESNVDFLRVFGDRARGVQTDTASALAASTWGMKARDALLPTGRPGEALLSFLRRGTPTDLRPLVEFARTPAFENAALAVEQAGRAGRSVHELAADAAERADIARQFAASVSELGVRSHVSITGLRTIAATAERAGQLRHAISTRVIAGVTRPDDPPATTAIRAGGAVRYAQQVLNSKLPIQLKQWLLSQDCHARFETLRTVTHDALLLLRNVQTAYTELEGVAPVSVEHWLKCGSIDACGAQDLHDHCNACIEDRHGLALLMDSAFERQGLAEQGLGRFVDLMLASVHPVSALCDACRRVIYQSIAYVVLSARPALLNFAGPRYEAMRSTFRALDRRLIALRGGQIAHALMQRPIPPGTDRGPRGEWTDLKMVAHVSGLQRPRTSVRHVMKQASAAIQQLMPCFMMSPLSIAQNLPPSMSFDLVIMDEASQLRPEDAIGAIRRSKQVVIVGDPKQLPPTSFFTGSADEAGADESTAADEASILEAAMPVMRNRSLNWHYRSRHHSLIAFSNHEFYDNRLIIFPPPLDASDSLGVRYVHVKEGCYHEGGTNPNEAVRVAAEVLSCIQRFPERTLGVVALNQKHAELLRDEFSRLELDDPVFREWMRQINGNNPLEQFFVKNLENVQGDERDVIVVSTVYGKNESEVMHQRFGPINQQGGHRRLNVLFSRAKMQTIVCSSMEPGDIKVTETSSRGVRALQGYLAFARDGRLERAIPTGRPPDSPFEEAVAAALAAEGFCIEPQVGMAGYFIDIGVRHPTRPGAFALGVECDGATYHSSKSARDRDRLRQEILEKLGWRLHRIWSLDWFRNLKGETRKLVDAARAAIAIED